MLKRTSMAAITALALSGTDLSALPIGNPLDATWLSNGVFWEGNCCGGDQCCDSWNDAWSLRIGYYGDYVFDRRLEIDQGNDQPNIRQSELYTNAAYIAFNFWNRFDVFGTLGSSRFHLHTPATAFPQLGTFNNRILDLDLDGHCSWSIGVRGTVWECGCFGIGAEGQYFCYNTHLRSVSIAGSEPTYFSDAKTRYKEYQLGAGATYKIPIAGCCGAFVVPYIAGKWSPVKVNFGDYLVAVTETIDGATATTLLRLANLENQRCFGWAVGLTLVGCNWWSITAEARFFDERAFHINSQIRF